MPRRIVAGSADRGKNSSVRRHWRDRKRWPIAWRIDLASQRTRYSTNSVTNFLLMAAKVSGLNPPLCSMACIARK